jgi:hypothetical protein
MSSARTRSKPLRLACFALLCALCAGTATAPRPGAASEAGYAIWVAGKVLDVDARHGRLRVLHGPTETAGAGVEECFVPGPALERIRPGMEIEAQVDSRRHPWRVLHLHVMLRTSPRRSPAPQLV